MTHVFVTRTGSKYHASHDCPSFADSQASTGRPVEPWQVELHGLSEDKNPCSKCWPLTSGYDAWRQLELTVEQTGDSPFEATFVGLVLRHIPGLRPSDVATQCKAHGHSGGVYFLDFVIQSDGGHRVAVEIDGVDKTPGQKSPAEVRRSVDRRRADLMAAGWQVLNFTNDRVATHSEECIVELRTALQPAVTPRHADKVAVAPTAHPPAPDTPPMRPVTWAESMSHPQAKAAAASAASPQLRPATPPESTAHARAASSPPTPPPHTGAATSPRRRRRPALAWLLGAVGVAAALVAYAVFQPTGGGSDSHPIDGACPKPAQIKGNISDDGDKIYHLPGWKYYAATDAEACFETEADAQGEGFRASRIQ